MKKNAVGHTAAAGSLAKNGCFGNLLHLSWQKIAVNPAGKAENSCFGYLLW
jgi:hypothetical protein